MLRKPLLTEDQWNLVTALERAGRASNIVAMPGTRFQHWFRGAFGALREGSKLNNPAMKKLGRNVAGQFDKMTIPLVLAKIAGNYKYLGLGITDDDLVKRSLAKHGVMTLTWSTAIGYLRRDQVSLLIDIVENSISCSRAAPPTEVHLEEALLKKKIAEQFHLAWPRQLDRTKLDEETAAVVNAELEKRRGDFSIFRDVAVSRIINISPGEQIDPNMQRVFDTSDVDFVIHGRAPHNIPLVAIEYDGNEHRTNPKKIANDLAKNQLLATAGIALLRIGTDIARAQSPGEQLRPQHLHVAPMLGIARAILEREVTLRTYADEDRQVLLRDIRDTNTIATALYDKKVAELKRDQLEKAFSIQQSISQAERRITNAERAANDLDDEIADSLASHLEGFGVDPACVSELSICSTRYGKVGKARLQLDNGSAIRSIETAPVSLNAPFFSPQTVDRLVEMQIHAELAYKAFQVTSSTQ